VPELLFGHLLTGSNFDDNEKRVTGTYMNQLYLLMMRNLMNSQKFSSYRLVLVLSGGRHGYGAKLTNIFSKSFTVETLDSKRKLQYQQTWNDNMTIMSDPEIVKVPSKEKDYTRISFVPDMSKLTGNSNQRTISEADYAIMCRRVIDVAGCAAGVLRVTLNGQDVSFASFEEYSNMYRQSNGPPLKFSKINHRWSIGIGLSESGSFDSVSFVNGMATSRGGTHLNAIVQQVTKHIEQKINKSHADLTPAISQSLIRRNLFVTCNALIENPSFDSQMKESLTSSPDSFGSSCKLTTKYLNELVIPEENGGPGIVEEIVKIAQRRFADHLLKEVGGSNKSKRQLLSIPKLDDAHLAGSDKGVDCTLILTEGDSAKALAIAGLEVIGRELYGVFPLRGKFLNVRDATVLQLAKNAEVKSLCAILGLDFDKEYDTVAERSELRYGHVMLMTDQDNDGSHIKGLIVNFFRHFWPKLLKPALDHPLDRPFLSSFITPLLKATKKGKKVETLSFYSMAEFIEWRSAMSNPDELKSWNIKYYKGLGTSTPAEAKEYFKAFRKHHRPFHWNSELDGELLDMVFDKNRASDRRKWILEEYDEEKTVTPDPDRDYSVTYEDFINNELIHFSNADNIRSLPHVVDGLKPSQRKVLYACFKRKLKAEVKVAQLSGYCAEHTAYHHGEASLQATSKFTFVLCSSRRVM
jgi:DNA topoisomerase-2